MLLKDVLEKLVQHGIMECKCDKHGVPFYRTIVDEAAFKNALAQLQIEGESK